VKENTSRSNNSQAPMNSIKGENFFDLPSVNFSEKSIFRM